MKTEEKLKQGCGKEFTEQQEDYTCGEDFPDDDGEPWCILCPVCQAKLSGYLLCKKEQDKKVGKLKDEIDDAQEDCGNLDWISKEQALNIINKIFGISEVEE